MFTPAFCSSPAITPYIGLLSSRPASLLSRLVMLLELYRTPELPLLVLPELLPELRRELVPLLPVPAYCRFSFSWPA